MYTKTFKGGRLLPELKEAVDMLRQAWSIDDDRDVRPLMFTLSQLEAVSPRLAGYILTRTAAITSYEWNILPFDPKDAERAENVKRRLTKGINSIIREHINTYLYGVFAPKLGWKKNTQGWFPIITFRDPTEIEYNPAFEDNIALIQEVNGKLQRYTLGVPQSYLAQVFKPRRRGGILASTLPSIILLNYNQQDWANFNRKLKGLSVAKWRRGAPAEEQSAAANAVRTLGENNMAAVSEDIMFEFKSFVDAMGRDSYKAFKEQLEADIAIAIKGETNTQQLPSHGGSRAALEVQQAIGADITWMTLLDIEALINDQLLVHEWWWSQEKSQNPDLPYRFKFTTAELQDQETNARIAEMLHSSGVDVDSAWYYNMFNAPVPEGTPTVLRKPQEEGFGVPGGIVG